MRIAIPKASLWPVSLRSWLRRNPVMLKELRARMRGKRAFWLLTIYLGLLSVLVSIIYIAYLSASGQPFASADQRQVVGKAIFGAVVWLELLVVSFVAPALTAGGISSEREHQTYDLLRTTLLPARSLVLGKFLSGLVFILLLLFAALPLHSLAYLIGGVSSQELWIAALVLVVTASAFCAAGIFFSSLVARTLVSTVLAYGVAIMLVFGLPLLALILAGLVSSAVGGFGQLGPLWEILVILGGWLLVSINPLATAIFTELILLEEQSLFLFHLPVSGAATLTLPSPWLPYVLIYLLLSVILLRLSVQRVKRAEK